MIILVHKIAYNFEKSIHGSKYIFIDSTFTFINHWRIPIINFPVFGRSFLNGGFMGTSQK